MALGLSEGSHKELELPLSEDSAGDGVPTSRLPHMVVGRAQLLTGCRLEASVLCRVGLSRGLLAT